MWSSGGEELNSSKVLKRVSSSSSSLSSASSSSTSSFPSPFSVYQNPRTKTMEEVWKDITLSSLQERPSSRDDPNSTSFRGLMFQDFLARPFNKVDPRQTTRFGSGSPAPTPTPPPPPPPPPPVTMLTLNSGPEFDLFGSSNPLISSRQNQLLQPRPAILQTGSMNMRFDGLDSCAGMNVHGNVKKRCPEPDNGRDRRHKRMIKNRESAARSRARKQAYTSELELEVDQLTKENARLKERQRQLCLAAADQQHPKKHALYRTSTAPF